MSDSLNVTLIQSKLYWENIESNLRMFSKKIRDINGETDLIILPEMFSTGFSINAAQLAEPADGETFQWMVAHSKKYNCAITGSVIISENDEFYNRLFFVFPDGSFEKYDKKHTFTYAGENEIYTAGTELLIIQYKGWKICPLICYDLRFPVWARNTHNYDLLIFIANWPKVRTLAWETLLRARSIENMAYCAGVNRVGTDGNNHDYIGHSVVYDVLGKQISTTASGEFTETVILDKAQIAKDRNRFRFLDDRDPFRLTE